MTEVDRILRSAARLSLEEKKTIAERIMAQEPTGMPSAADRYIDLVSAAEHTVGASLDSSRCMTSVMIRRFVAYRMHKEGYRYMDIAAAMGIHHSTVIHHVHAMQDCFDMPLVFADDLNLYMRFTDKL